MAEMQTNEGGKKKGPGVKKGKKLSTRVDLTPMVDLGFLLITFFIFTTTMSQPTAMRLFLPDDRVTPEQQNKAKESGSLTILLGKDNHVFYYEGILSPDGSNFKSTNFKGIRDEIINKKRTTDSSDLVVIIKPGDESTYRNVVNILDEMQINVIKRYALVSSLFPAEVALMKATEGGAPAPTASK